MKGCPNENVNFSNQNLYQVLFNMTRHANNTPMKSLKCDISYPPTILILGRNPCGVRKVKEANMPAGMLFKP